jgi:propanol-preferring alcohol dehydrogenase
MKAMVLREFGGWLKREDVPIPKWGPRDALVKIQACAVGRLDNWVRLGYMNEAWNVRLPIIPGHQVSGEVVEVGIEGEGVKVGDRVVVHVLITCEKCGFCRSLREPHCAAHTHIGGQCDGGLAEYIKMPASNLIKIPDDMTFEDATMVPVNIGTSWHILQRRAKLKPLEEVLVIGAGGGVGIHLIQLAKSMGAKQTIAVDVSENALTKLRELGVDHTVLSKPGRVTFDSSVKEITGGRGVDVAVEFVCLAETLEATLRSLAIGGRMVIVGVHRGAGFLVDPRQVLRREATITGSRALSRSEVAEAVEILRRGMVKPVITGRYPLEEANHVLELDMANKIIGRAVIVMR